MPTDTPVERDARAINAAITSYLEYYVDPGHPLDYAVLVSGPWGAGKTHLVNGFLAKSSAKPLYVSLYGMTSTSQIEEEFYRQLHPVLSHKGMKLAGSVVRAFAKGALKLDFNGDGKDDGSINFGLPEIDLKKDLSDPRNRLLVFDDLERCKMPVGEVLGFINGFVEHDGLKAIIIANETKVMAADRGYLEVKEKLIGQTLVVAAAADDAFDEFLKGISDTQTRAFLGMQRATVLALHAQGGRGNLRTLKHAMWDFEKIASQFEDRHWANEGAAIKLLKGVMALAMENRAGGLDDDVLQKLLGNRIGRIMRLNSDKPRGPADDIDDRYPQVDFDDVCLPAGTLGAVLLRGDVDTAAIRAALGASADFAPKAAQPLWSRAQQAFQEDDATAAVIVAEIEAAFAATKVVERGELMHLLGTRLWFADVGMIPLARVDVLAQGLDYIARIEEAGLIAAGFDERGFDRDGSHFGYRVFDSETPEFRQLADAYAAARARQERARYPAIALDLLARLPVEPDEVLLDCVVNNVRQAPYHDHPVFIAIPPADFATQVLAWKPKTQTNALDLLKSRHGTYHAPNLAPERLWLNEVDRLLTAALPDLQPMSRYRLRSLIGRSLGPFRPPSAPPASASASTTTSAHPSQATNEGGATAP